MYLFRALNNFDIMVDPTINGIASKKMIFKIVQNYYENSNDKEYRSLDGLGKEQFIKEHVEEYLKTHQDRLRDKFDRYSSQSREDIKDFCELNRIVKSRSKEEIEEQMRNNTEGIKFGSLTAFYTYLSSLQQHLMYGSSTITDWISFSTSFKSALKYYEEQDIHKLAVVRSNTGGLVDSDYILTVDLSDPDKIKNKGYLCNKIYIDEGILDYLTRIGTLNPGFTAQFNDKLVKKTDINSRGFKYANSSKEVCAFKYIPQDHVVSVLESLQIDLLRSGLFNEEFLKLPLDRQKACLEQLKKTLEFLLLNQNDPFVLHVFRELYVENKDLSSLVNFQDSEEKIKHSRGKILGLAKSVANYQIKRD